jgi:hypothetical protein
MAVRETDLARIQRFCEERTPLEFRDRMRLEAAARGNSVTITDHEPLFGGAAGEWMSRPIAQLRYQPQSRRWTLYWADRNDRWHPYEQLRPTVDLRRVLAEIEADPTCIFFG